MVQHDQVVGGGVDFSLDGVDVELARPAVRLKIDGQFIFFIADLDALFFQVIFESAAEAFGPQVGEGIGVDEKNSPDLCGIG